MRTLFFTSFVVSSLLLIGASASAQVLIENPEYGTVDFEQRQLLVNDVPVTTTLGTNSTYVATQGTCNAGESTSTEGVDTEGSALWEIVHNLRGAIEFNIDGVEIPTSITSQNFTARLVGLQGAPPVASTSISIDLYDMTNEQENFVIGVEDYLIDHEADVPINGDPFINGEFDEIGIDVTAQLRQDLFGGDADAGVSSGFILMGSGGSGVINFPMADVYLEINLVGSDTDTDSDTNVDTSVVIDSDTNSDTAVDTNVDTNIDTASDTGSVADSDTGTGNGDSDTYDSEYWETDDDSDNGSDDDVDGDKIKCSCTTAGSTVIQSIFSLLF